MSQEEHSLIFHEDSLVLNGRTHTFTSDEDGYSSIVLFLNDGVRKSVLKLGGTLNEPLILPHVRKLGITAPQLLAAGTVTISQTNPVYAKLCADFIQRACYEDLIPDRVNYVHLEYLPGIPLARLGKGVDYRSFLLQSIQIIYTLNMASILHGDINPYNIIVNNDKAHLIDWSSAEMVNDGRHDLGSVIDFVFSYVREINTCEGEINRYDSLVEEIDAAQDITVAREKVTELVQKYL